MPAELRLPRGCPCRGVFVQVSSRLTGILDDYWSSPAVTPSLPFEVSSGHDHSVSVSDSRFRFLPHRSRRKNCLVDYHYSPTHHFRLAPPPFIILPTPCGFLSPRQYPLLRCTSWMRTHLVVGWIVIGLWFRWLTVHGGCAAREWLMMAVGWFALPSTLSGILLHVVEARSAVPFIVLYALLRWLCVRGLFGRDEDVAMCWVVRCSRVIRPA
ncbi:hypothetical protein R3P38DRAFT_3003357, partial [Favolaschia claudopus]